MKKNIFIKSLKFGEDKIEQGISFNELIGYLKNDLKNNKRMPYNPNVHHRMSIWLRGYDYSQPGLYLYKHLCTKQNAFIWK